MSQILTPKPIALWLVDNTTLTFEQIADFCNLHRLEVQSIADGEIAQGVRPMDPISSGHLSREELAKGAEDPHYSLTRNTINLDHLELKPIKKRRYTPLSQRHNRPKAISWLLRHHSALSDTQISRLIGTTRTTIAAIRNRTHWDIQNIEPMDPVILGFCSQIELDAEIARLQSETPAPDEVAEPSS